MNGASTACVGLIFWGNTTLVGPHVLLQTRTLTRGDLTSSQVGSLSTCFQLTFIAQVSATGHRPYRAAVLSADDFNHKHVDKSRWLPRARYQGLCSDGPVAMSAGLVSSQHFSVQGYSIRTLSTSPSLPTAAAPGDDTNIKSVQ